MRETVLDFYDSLAPHYHLLFGDWNESIERQARVLASLLASRGLNAPLRILDCACGIGTQALGFAMRGHRVTASDLSAEAVARAKREAQDRQLDISFHISDMVSLAEIAEDYFDVVAALDNALAHLTPIQLNHAVRAMGSKLRPGGWFLASIRDYDALIVQKPTIQGPAYYGEQPERRIVHQLWDWIESAKYIVHLYITIHTGVDWVTHHFTSEYRCLKREELSSTLLTAGLTEIRWLMPAESGFYQPIVLAQKPQTPERRR
jgi:glycine/sarcosine N-methyltransferase